MVYLAPDEPNPMQQARVSRQAIEALQTAGYEHNERPIHRSVRPNKPLELTPLRVEQDRCDFEGWSRLDCFPDQEGRRS